MKLLVSTLVCFIACVQVSGFVFGGLLDKLRDSEWNTLKVTWPIPKYVPRTTDEAKDNKFAILDESAPCEGTVAKGFRYCVPGEATLCLLYDVNGYVAGVQAHYLQSKINEDQDMKTWYDNSPLTFVDKIGDVDTYSITAYLVDPETICNGGRSSLNATATGVTFLQQGGELIQTQRQEVDIDQSVWTKGKCFASMGTHYWIHTSEDMDCKDFKPAFVLYNRDNKMTGFGFAAFDTFKNSRYENPSSESFSWFMDPVPKCLTNWSDKYGVSTMHVYLNQNYLKLACL